MYGRNAPRALVALMRVALRALRWSALCALMVSGCGDEHGTPGAASGAALAGTEWDLDASSLGVRGAGSVNSWIAFERDRVSGNDGCNQFSGSCRLDGSKLTFGPLAATQMACSGPADEVARQVTAALPRVRTFDKTADALHLRDAGGKTVLSYTASTPGVAGNWSVISVLYDDAIRSVIAGAELTADFSTGGRITGSTGCNSFHGDYTLQGKKLRLDPLTPTKKACPTPELTKQEAGYLAALESAVRIDQVGPELTLLNAKGQMAVTLTRK
jgi:heat shock protein HslJ